MDIYAWKLCTKFAETHYTSILAFTTNSTVRTISRQLYASWNHMVCWSLPIFTITWSPFDLTLDAKVMTCKKNSFVGAKTEVNCNESQISDIVTKKNTPISRRSVLEAVCYHLWILIKPNIACRNNLCNFFAGCYV